MATEPLQTVIVNEAFFFKVFQGFGNLVFICRYLSQRNSKAVNNEINVTSKCKQEVFCDVLPISLQLSQFQWFVPKHKIANVYIS